MKTKISLQIFGLGILLAATCLALRAADIGFILPPETAKLKRGPGADLVTAQCLLCHSADYISTQPAFTRAQWTAIVQKMAQKYGAPIVTNRVEELADYLVKTYGTESSPKSAAP